VALHCPQRLKDLRVKFKLPVASAFAICNSERFVARQLV